MSIVGITLGVMNWRTHPLALALVSGTLLCLIGLGLWRTAWGFEQPLSWILLGRREREFTPPQHISFLPTARSLLFSMRFPNSEI